MSDVCWRIDCERTAETRVEGERTGSVVSVCQPCHDEMVDGGRCLWVSSDE